MATEPAESTKAQNDVEAQLMSAAESVPSWTTDLGCPQDPDVQVATDPSERATLQEVDVGQDTE